MTNERDESEDRRLQRLRALMVLDTEQEPIFDSLAALASSLCGTPIALLSLIDRDRQWFKANLGLPGVPQTPRDVAFCDHAIRGETLMEVADAQQDPRFAGNPLVTGAPDIRFYAGAPLVMASGERIGTLCVIDRQPRQLSAQQREALGHLARLAVQALEMRERSIQQSLAVRTEHERTVAESERRFRAILDVQSELVSQSTPQGRLVYVNPAYAAFFGTSVEALTGSDLYQHVLPEDRDTVRERLSRVLIAGEVVRSENRMVSPAGEERWVSWTNTRQLADDGSVLLHSTGRDVTARVLARRALAHSEALLEQTGRAAGVGGWELDIRTGRVSWTSETRRIHEVPPDFQPTLERALDFYTADSRALVEAAVRQALVDGTPWDLELQLVTARGRTLWARAIGEVEMDDGQPVRMFGAFQDITERRETERARQEIAAIFENSPDFIVQADRQRRIRYMNPAAARVMLGRPWRGAAEGEGEVYVSELLPEATQRKFVETILPALEASGVWIGQSEIHDARRREITASHMVIAHRDARGEVERYSIVWRDISELIAAQAERERQARTLRSVADAIPSSVAVVDRDGRYVMANPAFERALGLPANRILGRTARDVLGESEFESRRPWIERAFAGEAVRFEREQLEAGALRNFGIEYLPLRSADGQIDGFVVVGQDITRTKQEHSRLQTLSWTDSLTKLLNRSGFEQRLLNHFDPLAIEPVALLYCDLDHFKAVNDSHGHAAGDELLKLVARRLVRLVRPSDAVARLGGDEFAMILPGMRSAEDAQRVGQSIVNALEQPFQIAEGVEVTIGGSVGIALAARAEADSGTLLARADEMLYEAKRAGRGRVALSASGAAASDAAG